MSLIINNLATDKQIAMLNKLEYSGTGQYAAHKLTKQQAAELLDELFEQQRQEEQAEEFKYNDPGVDQWGN